MGLYARKDNHKLGAILDRAVLMQAVPVRSCIIVCVHKPADVSANVAREDSGALFYVTVKEEVSTMMCFRLLLLYSKPNRLLKLAIS